MVDNIRKQTTQVYYSQKLLGFSGISFVRNSQEISYNRKQLMQP